MLDIKEELVRIVKEAVKKSLAVDVETVSLERPKTAAFGDYSSNIALTLAKATNRPPLEIAKRLVLAIPMGSDLLERAEVAPPGFLNFTLTKQLLLHNVARALSVADLFGCTKLQSGKKIMIEYAHPNTHKQFHIGHLRNITLGESLVRLLESQGVAVIRANYQGDVGLHVAKALYGLLEKISSGDRRLADIEQLALDDKVALLGEAYVEGHKAYESGGEDQEAVTQLNKKIYNRDQSIFQLWSTTRSWSLSCFDAIYRRLGSHFDRLYFESEVFEEGINITKKALREGTLKSSQGAVVFDGEPYGLDTRVFITREGIPTYEAKELGLAALEFSEFGKLDKCLHVVAPEQDSFFKVTFKVEELLDRERYAGKQEHFAYGYVDLKEGKMSSRAGNVVTALSLIDSAKQRAKKLIRNTNLTPLECEEVAEKVAIGAVKYSLLRYGPRSRITFDLDESVALQGNSGPYLQYTYARARSVISKLGVQAGIKSFIPAAVDMNVDELALARMIFRFPEIVRGAAENYAPNLLCEYLYTIAQKFNAFYDKNPILKAEVAAKELRFLLTAASAQVVKNGLNLLGIEVMETM